jgi:hypothetical protein
MKQFTMSMFGSHRELYKSKSEYLQEELEKALALLVESKGYVASGRDWNMVDRINKLLVDHDDNEY